MNTKAILKSTGRFLRIIWDCTQEYLTGIGEFLWRKKWWFVAALFCLVFIPVFLTLHYEKGLGVGDALFFSLAGIFGAALIAAIVVFILIWLLLTVGRIVKAIRENTQEVPTPAEEKTDTPPVPEGLKPIDTERLAPYFKSGFKGMGSNINYFQILMDTMNTFRTESQRNVGAVALLIYKSDKMNNLKPDTFSKWITIFFECMGLEVPADKSKNKYRLDTMKDKDMKLRTTFNYI